MRTELIAQYYDSPEYLAKLRNKMAIIKKMEEDDVFRNERIMDVYAADPIAFIEDCLLLKLTEFGGNPKPFFLFPYQKKIILQIQEWELSNQDIESLIDKPRGMGLTWIIAAYFLWRWLFTPNYSCFILSRSETEVDDGTSIPDNSIFGKIRWMMARIPKSMIPDGFQFKKARGTQTDMTLKIINPKMGSSIIGSSTNANAGRSRRYSTIFIDECFSIDRFNEVYRSLQSVARLKIFVSTVKFGRVFDDFKKMIEKDGTYISLSWKDHPFKDQIWYEQQLKKAEFDPEVMKEVEPSYAIPEKSQYYPQIKDSKLLPLEYNYQCPIYCGLDFGGRQDLTVIIYAQFVNGFIHVLDAYWNTNKPTAWYAPFLNNEISYNPEMYNEYQRKFLEKLRTWKRAVGYFGEVDHLTKRRPDNKSDQDALAPYGIHIRVNQYAVQYAPRRIAVTTILPKTIFNTNSDAAMRIYDAISQSRYGNFVRTTSEQLKPIHDPEIADMRAAFENLAVNLPRVFRNQREDFKSGDDKSFASALIKSLRI